MAFYLIFFIKIILPFQLMKMHIENHIHVNHIMALRLRERLESSTMILLSQWTFWRKKNQQKSSWKMVQDVQIGRYERQMKKEKIEIAKWLCYVPIFFDSILFQKKSRNNYTPNNNKILFHWKISWKNYSTR